MNQAQKLSKLNIELKKLYKRESKKLLFHGWHHINFVRNKSVEFARSIKANLFIVESSALVHDLNYIIKVYSKAEKGASLRKSILKKCSYTTDEIERIESIILECETATRGKEISLEGKAVSDGDTLFKTLPITPIIFASKYIAENKIDIQTLAKNIITDQKRLFDAGIYFYTPLAKKKYLRWAKQQIQLWESVAEALNDKDVQEILSIAKTLKVL